jgi:hypothetical protein
MTTQDLIVSFMNAAQHPMYRGHRHGGPNFVRQMKMQERFLKLVYASFAVGAYLYGLQVLVGMIWMGILWMVFTMMSNKLQREEQLEWFDAGHALVTSLVLQDSTLTLQDAIEYIIASDRIYPLRVDRDTSDFLSGTDFRNGDIAYVLDDNTSCPISEDSLRQLFIANNAQTRGRNPFTNLPVQRFRKVRLEVEL